MLDYLVDELCLVPPSARADADMACLLGDALRAYSGWKRPLFNRPGGYSRTCVYYDERFEVLLLNWSPGVASALHDHGGQRCWLGVAEGSFYVENYRRLDAGEVADRALVVPDTDVTLQEGDLDVRSDRFDIHRVTAFGKANAVTLHIYARPLRAFRVYDEFAQRCRVEHGGYDEILPFANKAVGA